MCTLCTSVDLEITRCVLFFLFLPLFNDSREPRDGWVDKGLNADDCLGHGGGVVGGHGGMGERYDCKKATFTTLCCSKTKKKKKNADHKAVAKLNCTTSHKEQYFLLLMKVCHSRFAT